MIAATAALNANLRAFFETELRGLFDWDDVERFPDEPAEQQKGKRRNIYGRFREVVKIQFGVYEISVKSPNEAPPLGLAELSSGGAALDQGPLDVATWRRFGAQIKQREGTENG